MITTWQNPWNIITLESIETLCSKVLRTSCNERKFWILNSLSENPTYALGKFIGIIYWSNQLVENTKDYFRFALTIPFLDHVSVDLWYRFPGNKLPQYRGLFILPYVVLNESSNWKIEFIVFANYYYNFQILMTLMWS